MTLSAGHVERHAPYSLIPLDALDESVVARFERTASEHSANVAVLDDTGALTYRELNAAANRLALELLESHEGGAQEPIALLLAHNKSAILAMMGVLKAGRPYVALHTSNPPERLLSMITDAGARSLITERKFAPAIEKLLAADEELDVLFLDDINLREGAEDPGIHVSGAAPFTISYTSGTTGDPKGLWFSHGNVNFCSLREAKDWGITAADRVTLLYSVSFGAAYACIMNAFFRGGTLCMYDFGASGPDAALDWIQRHEITLLRPTPSMWRAMWSRAAEDLVLPSVRLVSMGGEAARVSDAKLFQQHTLRGCLLENTFASSEAGVVALFTMGHDTILEGENLPAGFPVPGHEVRVLGDDGLPVRAGEVGEIVIRSRHLHQGYWRKPQLTAERFVSDPVDASIKTLHSGDLGRWLADGTLEYAGRKDSMVKIRGYRVELSEIEFHLRDSSLVADAAVVARELRNLPGVTQLVGYVSPRAGRVIDLEALRLYLASRLPEYSIPSAFVVLDALPLNSHGKVDKAALPEVSQRLALGASDMPANAVEQKLVEIWGSLLKTDRTSVNDNFFELGGDSLSVLSMALDVEKALGKAVPRTFFKQPTIRGLAGLLANVGRAAEAPSASFLLEAYAPGSEAPAWRKRDPLRWSYYRTRRRVHVFRRSHDEVFYFEWLLAHAWRHLTFEAAQAEVARLADHTLILTTVYRRRYALFLRFLQSLSITRGEPLSCFRDNLRANLLLRLMEAIPPFRDRGSSFTRDRRRIIDETPIARLDERFPVAGLPNLLDAISAGRGVILLSFHGSAEGRASHLVLARRLGVLSIETIAHAMAHRQAGFWRTGSGDPLPGDVAASLYAELALHGQRRLQQGNIIHIAGDVSRDAGRMYSMRIGDREYQLRPGFAELALNAGAKVIPTFGRFTQTGGLMLEFLPPLDAGRGSREAQVEALVRQFAGFVDSTLRCYPEIVTWRKMRNHLNLPRIPAVPSPR